jgi:hypothetical protein
MLGVLIMEINAKVRAMFNDYIARRGVKIYWIAEQLGYNYSNLVQWRKGNKEYSDIRCQEIKIFLEKY